MKPGSHYGRSSRHLSNPSDLMDPATDPVANEQQHPHARALGSSLPPDNLVSARDNARGPPLDYVNPAHLVHRQESISAHGFVPFQQTADGYQRVENLPLGAIQHQASPQWVATTKPTFTRGGQYIGRPMSNETKQERKRTTKSRSRSRPRASRHLPSAARVAERQPAPRFRLQTPDDATPPQWSPPDNGNEGTGGDIAFATSNRALPPLGACSGPGMDGGYGLFVSPSFNDTLASSSMTACTSMQAYNEHAGRTLGIDFQPCVSSHTFSSNRSNHTNVLGNALNNRNGLLAYESPSTSLLDVLKRLTSMAVECDYLRSVLLQNWAPAAITHHTLCDLGALEQANIEALRHNHNITELDEPLKVVFPTSNDPSFWCLESVPATARKVLELDHAQIDTLLRAYGADAVATAGKTVFLHDKMAVYLRIVGASIELLMKVLD